MVKKQQGKKRTQQGKAGESSGALDSGRRLLTKVKHSVSPRIVKYVLSVLCGLQDVLDPVTVECVLCAPSLKASFDLAFDMLTQCSGPPGTSTSYYNLDVVVRNLIAPSAPCSLQIEATVEWYKRPVDCDVTQTDKSQWPAPETPVKVTLDGEGRIGSFCHRTLRALTVHLDVYAVGSHVNCTFATVLGGLDALRREKTLSDVELRVDGEVYPAHRAVLAANSPVFCSMFSSGLKEATEGVVDVVGPTARAFEVFLRFLYSGTVGDWNGCEIELLELADRYMVAPLKAVCEERMTLQLDWSVALRILEQATKPVISSDVRVNAVRTVAQNWDAVVDTKQWRDFKDSFPVLADSVLAGHQLHSERRK